MKPIVLSLAVIWFALWLFSVGLLVRYRRLADEADFWRTSAARWQARARQQSAFAARANNRLDAITKICQEKHDASA